MSVSPGLPLVGDTHLVVPRAITRSSEEGDGRRADTQRRQGHCGDRVSGHTTEAGAARGPCGPGAEREVSPGASGGTPPTPKLCGESLHQPRGSGAVSRNEGCQRTLDTGPGTGDWPRSPA